MVSELFAPLRAGWESLQERLIFLPPFPDQLDTLEKNVAIYTTGTNSLIKARKESLNTMLGRVDDQFDSIQQQYDNYYNRYLKQYTNMMQIMNSMEQTFGMF